MYLQLTVLVSLLIFTMNASMAQRPPKKPSSPSASEKAAQKTVETFAHALATNDTNSLQRVCSETVALIESGRRLDGLPLLLDYLQIHFKNFPQMEFELGPIEVNVSRTTAWAQAETRQTLVTEHGLKVQLTGHSFFILGQQRQGWKIALVNLDLKQESAEPADEIPAAGPGLTGSWMLESSKNLTTGQSQKEIGTLIMTETRFCYIATASDRQPPKEKRLSDYSRKELQDILSGVESSAGTYRREGNVVLVTIGHPLWPQQAGRELSWENIVVTPDHLTMEVVTPQGRVERVWRRVR